MLSPIPHDLEEQYLEEAGGHAAGFFMNTQVLGEAGLWTERGVQTHLALSSQQVGLPQPPPPLPALFPSPLPLPCTLLLFIESEISPPPLRRTF